ncbi:unnamed protein product, partial [Phaeothamnion confervicola]
VYDSPLARFDPAPKVVFIPDQELRAYNSSVPAHDAILNKTGDIYYKWYFGDGSDTLQSGLNPLSNDPNTFHSPVHIYDTEGVYEIALVAVNKYPTIECSNTVKQTIQARAAGSAQIPNAFTPNPAGPNGGAFDNTDLTKNDVFLPVTKGVKEFQMQIFDRWGNLVFESQSTNIGWDGYDRNGRLLPAGVYVYKLVLRMANDQRTTQVGDVTLIR